MHSTSSRRKLKETLKLLYLGGSFRSSLLGSFNLSELRLCFRATFGKYSESSPRFNCSILIGDPKMVEVNGRLAQCDLPLCRWFSFVV